MGTRYGDQPPEHWAGPESLDPTPVWKQYLLIALLVLGSLALVAVVATFALAVELATPPALVPGGRLVLARTELPAVNVPGKRIGAPIVAERDAFFLAQPSRDEIVAVGASWRAADGAAECAVEARLGGFAACGATFGPRGEPLEAPRSLDRYLVSVEGSKLVVNVSRRLAGYGKTPQPALTPFR